MLVVGCTVHSSQASLSSISSSVHSSLPVRTVPVLYLCDAVAVVRSQAVADSRQAENDRSRV